MPDTLIPSRGRCLSSHSLLARCGAALALMLALAAPASAMELAPGKGVFNYRDPMVQPRENIRVFYHAPAQITPETDLWIVIHGAGRNAEGYRDGFVEPLGSDNVLLIVPEFTTDNFPGSKAYNLGNMDAGRGRFHPEPVWTFSIIERLFDKVRADLNLKVNDYVIYGHSAGSQFVHRMLFLKTETRVRAAILANAGWYTMPDETVAFPYGLRGMPGGPERVSWALRIPVVVLLGDRDIDPNHRQLLRTPQAMAQGPFRLARGEKFFATAQEKASALGVPFGWTLDYVQGVGHSNSGMARGAVPHMRRLSGR